MEWNSDMSAAPRGGSIILLFNGRLVWAGRWITEDTEYPWSVLDDDITDGFNGLMERSVTHWMHLPPPPSQEPSHD